MSSSDCPEAMVILCMSNTLASRLLRPTSTCAVCFHFFLVEKDKIPPNSYSGCESTCTHAPSPAPASHSPAPHKAPKTKAPGVPDRAAALSGAATDACSAHLPGVVLVGVDALGSHTLVWCQVPGFPAVEGLCIQVPVLITPNVLHATFGRQKRQGSAASHAAI